MKTTQVEAKEIQLENRNATLRLIATVLVVLNFLIWSFRFKSELDVFMVGAMLGACTFGVIYVALLEVLPIWKSPLCWFRKERREPRSI